MNISKVVHKCTKTINCRPQCHLVDGRFLMSYCLLSLLCEDLIIAWTRSCFLDVWNGQLGCTSTHLFHIVHYWCGIEWKINMEMHTLHWWWITFSRSSPVYIQSSTPHILGKLVHKGEYYITYQSTFLAVQCTYIETQELIYIYISTCTIKLLYKDSIQ